MILLYFLSALLLFHPLIAIDPAQREKIQQTLQSVNEDFFFSHSMRLDLLKNQPQAISTLAEWLHEEWHPYDASLTKERLIHSFSTRMNSDRLPITFVTVKKGLPVGVVSLKEQTTPELSDFPENTIWMGSLQVAPEERNQGVGQELFRFVAALSWQLGYDKLYFYTSNPENVSWYLKRGALVIEERPFRHHTITIMYLPLKGFKGALWTM